MSDSGGRVPEPASFGQQRQDRLLELLRTHGSIVVREAARELSASEPTIRRDVNALARRGLVTRVHGGATLVDPHSPFRRPGARPTGRASTTPRLTLGMVVPSLGYYWPSIIAGARAAADDAGARLLLRSSSGSHDDRKQIRLLAETPGVQGLVVAPVVEVPESVELLRWLEQLPLPVVLAERRTPVTMPPGDLEWVASDHVAGAAMAVRHLHQAGHRGIGLFLAEGSPTAHQVRQGWQDELRSVGLDPQRQLAGRANGFTEPGRDELLDQVLTDCRRTGTTAVLVHPDPEALSLVQHCLDVGVGVPEHLSVVSYDDEVAHLGDPALTAVRPPKQHVGRLAVELLVARLQEGRRRPAHRVSIGPELVVRESSGPPDDAGEPVPAGPGTQERS